jgi:hypothetical protein
MLKFLLPLAAAAILIASDACSPQTSAASLVSQARPAEYKTKYVVILVIDGPRFTETFGDPSGALIPRMNKELRHQGVLFSNFRNLGSTTTTAGHTALLTGVYQHISNGGKELPKNPNIFQYYLKEKNLDKSKAWLVTSKGKLEVLANTRDKKWWNMYMPYSFCGPNGNSSSYGSDEPTVAKVKEVISGQHPHLMLVNLLAVDTYGHGNEWENYKKAITSCDQYAYEIWNHIQSDPEMKNRTALFITNDHGRHLDGHKDGFVSHGDKCEGCTHIAMLALGPDFKKDVEITTQAEQTDLSMTISKMLNFSMPTSTGRFLNELFD